MAAAMPPDEALSALWTSSVEARKGSTQSSPPSDTPEGSTSSQRLGPDQDEGYGHGREKSPTELLGSGIAVPVRTMVLAAAAAGPGRFARALARTRRAIELLMSIRVTRLCMGLLDSTAAALRSAEMGGGGKVLLNFLRS